VRAAELMHTLMSAEAHHRTLHRSPHRRLP
jgi:hypothetical protein